MRLCTSCSGTIAPWIFLLVCIDDLNKVWVEADIDGLESCAIPLEQARVAIDCIMRLTRPQYEVAPILGQHVSIWRRRARQQQVLYL